MNFDDMKQFLDEKASMYNGIDFIPNDPIAIPHQYTKKQNIEIAGFFAAILAWGKRTTIIQKTRDLMKRMDNTPHDFILHHKPRDLAAIENFKHRTFNGMDALYFIHFLNAFYKKNTSLENAFLVEKNDTNVKKGLIQFHKLFFSHDCAPDRTRKHIATPARNSACKRLNLFLRWMVRDDDRGVDFGLWKKIRPDQLVVPCDLHVERTARALNLITGKQINWKTALELTETLKQFDPKDPIKYDFALFGLSMEQRFGNK